MEDADESRLEELLMCPVCQDIFRDPRQLPCGHSQCMDCLTNLLDHSTDAPFRCPDCRAQFGAVVELQKSYALASIAEDFRLSKRRREKQAERVYCDRCPETKTPAFKSCLKCEVSLCREHTKDHLELRAFTGHPLVEPLSDLLERKCPQHQDQVLRYYCSSSRRYICNVCALQGKQLSAASDASAVLRRQLTDYMEEHFKLLREQITEAANAANSQRERQRGSALDRLNGVTVVLLFLWFIVLYYAYNYGVENQTLTDALERQQSRVHQIYSSIAEHMVDSPLKSHRSSRTQDEGAVMLDLDTASRLLGLSANLRSAERVKAALHYPDSAGRFDEAPQVLSSPCFSSGAHVWEVEAEGCWDVAVSYRSVDRKSRGGSTFGHNAESWSLAHSERGELSARHDKHETALSGSLPSGRIEVEVNFEEGRIRFSAADPAKTLLHEFKAELTQPVCLGLGLYHVDPPSRASIVKVS
ncbi:E3 ubiquitin-protein ligase TRIM11 [Fundulus heteroclitus]|uniref:E3 ubiquitin-protein ligase TRIM11 n=1 Tax=Fundulus heteroclitus TaxID=8078 RepID=UPI00165C45F1|nr:E3 ubiquitin-protein ligase TRIM11 [Fundulus heteroclitus]XP_035993898.1 E3 ubiquitin-protein ligase TRIM11 [Fundulus heteroclitus]XP_035993899.1 E3 ubiquitin-protein ligase TRIM11 [Fundulus heteroclitus]